MKSVVLLLMGFVLGLASPVRASESTKAIVASYLNIHAALSSDKVDGVKAAAAAIGKEAARMGAAGDAIQKAAKAVGSAADLEAARTAFGPLSDAVIAAARADGWKDVPSAKVAYCSMVDRHWIQTDDKIRNPYYGASMLTCGELKKR